MSPIIAFNKADILKKISITDDFFYTSLGFVIILFLLKFCKKEKFIKKIDNDTLKRLLLQIFLIIPVIYLSGLILQKENVFVFKSLQRSVSIIILVLYSIFIMKMKMTPLMILGSFLLVIGSYLIDYSTSNNN
tara:strand:+ start:793 stop:1191 length:399 start_codon:yes stop_codon:yes gene_type:complete